MVVGRGRDKPPFHPRRMLLTSQSMARGLLENPQSCGVTVLGHLGGRIHSEGLRVAESDFLVVGESVAMAEADRIPDLSVSEDMSKAIGIPPQEMTPNVRKAIVRLLDELERLRVELSETRSRIEYLERLAD